MLDEDAASASLPEKTHVDNSTKVIWIDFGSRDNAPTKWDLALQPFCRYIRTLMLGGEVKHMSPEEANKTIQERIPGGMTLANASDMRDAAMKRQGEKVYFEGLLSEGVAFKERGGIKGLKLVRAEGVESACKTWDDLAEGTAKGDIGPEGGFLFTL